jgi:2-phosphosulfolactate phosphatase
MMKDDFPKKKRVEVCPSPKQFELYQWDFSIVVAIDVLRATSAICAALDNGVKGIIPVSTLEEAFDYKRKGYHVGAERNGEVVEGFEFGNSPFSFMEDRFKGKTLVLSTTNGTRAINIASKTHTVVAGSLINLDALIEWLIEQDDNVLLLCSGWKDKFNLEDTICAGAITEALLATNKFKSDEDSTISAMFLYQSARDNYFSFLKHSSHRRRLKRLNLNEDIKYCLTPNQTRVIPILRKGVLVKHTD